MQKKYILATSAAIIVLVAGAFTYKVCAEKNNGVAAVVNGEQITIAEMREAYEQNQQIKEQVSFEDFYNRALDVMVNSKLALQAATKANIQMTPEYQKQLAELQNEIARQLYLEQQVEAKVTEADVKKVYDEYLAKFEPQKEIKAKHILVETEDEAKDIIAKLESKSDSFDTLAKQFSKDQPDLGYFTEKAMVPEFSEAAFAMEKGEISKEPVKTQFGYHIIFVEDIRETKPLALEDVEENIKSNLYQKAAAEVIKELNDNAVIEKFDLSGKKIEK